MERESDSVPQLYNPRKIIKNQSPTSINRNLARVYGTSGKRLQESELASQAAKDENQKSIGRGEITKQFQFQIDNY